MRREPSRPGQRIPSHVRNFPAVSEALADSRRRRRGRRLGRFGAALKRAIAGRRRCRETERPARCVRAMALRQAAVFKKCWSRRSVLRREARFCRRGCTTSGSSVTTAQRLQRASAFIDGGEVAAPCNRRRRSQQTLCAGQHFAQLFVARAGDAQCAGEGLEQGLDLVVVGAAVHGL